MSGRYGTLPCDLTREWSAQPGPLSVSRVAMSTVVRKPSRKHPCEDRVTPMAKTKMLHNNTNNQPNARTNAAKA